MTVARITCQTSRKGFSLRMKEDAHWSDALYQRLDEYQLKDGRDEVLLNCDDAVWFRLDTT